MSLLRNASEVVRGVASNMSWARRMFLFFRVLRLRQLLHHSISLVTGFFQLYPILCHIWMKFVQNSPTVHHVFIENPYFLKRMYFSCINNRPIELMEDKKTFELERTQIFFSCKKHSSRCVYYFYSLPKKIYTCIMETFHLFTLCVIDYFLQLSTPPAHCFQRKLKLTYLAQIQLISSASIHIDLQRL